MRKETQWTVGGLRVVAEVGGALLILTCESQAVIARETLERSPWMLAKLAFPAGTPRYQAEQMVKHWLSFYGDENFAAMGVMAFREVFSSLKEAVPAEEGGERSQGPDKLN